jgi:L-arabinonolactonase
MNIEPIGDGRYELGESPIWDPWDGVLYFVDCLACAIFRYDPRSGGIVRWDVACAYLGALSLRTGGGAILSMDDGIHSFDFETGVATAIPSPKPVEPICASMTAKSIVGVAS